MANNASQNRAKNNKYDEFYTRLVDIENELKKYKDCLEDKIIYCPCDDPEWSNFWKFFYENFTEYKLRKIISTHYIKNKKSYILEYNGKNQIKTPLKGDGDFLSNECIEILKSSDVIITNPPWSLFGKYYLILSKYKKDFILIGNKNSITHKAIFPDFVENKIRYGYTKPNIFLTPGNEETKQVQGLARWITTFPVNKKIPDLKTGKEYDKNHYPKLDNYDAINIDKTSNIPDDYEGLMSVPISFLDKYSPAQFTVIGEFNHGCDNKYDLAKPVLNGKVLFKRIAIIRKRF